MADASIALGLDARQMYRDLQDAVQRFNAGMDRIGVGANRAATAHNNLLKSNARVSNQFAHFFSMASAGGDSMSLLAGGIEAASHAMNLSLGLTAAGYVGGLAIQKVVAMREEWHKLNEELDRAAKPRDPSSTKPIEEDIKERRETIAKALPISEAEKARQERLAKQKQLTKPAELDLSPYLEEAHGNHEIARARAKAQRDANRNSWKNQPGVVDSPNKDHSWSDAMRATPAMEFSNKVAAAEQATASLEHFKKATDESTAALKRQQSKKESMQLSLEDIAKNGREWAPGNDTRSGAGRRAREALKEEALSRKEMLNEHWGEALMHKDRAAELKNSIGTLEDSGKDMTGAHLRALDSSVILREIASNTANRRNLNR